MRKAAPASSNLSDGYRAIGEAVIILTRSLKQFRLDKIEVCCGPQKLVCAMMLQGCRKAARAEAVERDHFATPNYLKSHGERNLLSPFGNTCAITPTRDFVPWRFSDAGRHSSWIASSCRHPKTCTRTDSCTAAKTSSHDRRSGLIIPFLNGSTVVIGSAEGSPASDARSVPRRAPTDRLAQLY
jgi:hypothetical protein